MTELKIIEFNIVKDHNEDTDKVFEDFVDGFKCFLPCQTRKLPILLSKHTIEEANGVTNQDPFADLKAENDLIEFIHGSDKKRHEIMGEFLAKYPSISKRAVERKMRSIAKKGSIVNPRLFELFNCKEEFFSLLQSDFDGLRESLQVDIDKENLSGQSSDSIFNEILIDLVKSSHSVIDSKNVLPEKICKKYEGANPVRVFKSHIESKMKDINKQLWCVSPEIYMKHVSQSQYFHIWLQLDDAREGFLKCE